MYQCVQNVFEKIQLSQANRLANIDDINEECLSTITINDVAFVLKQKTSILILSLQW